MNGEKGMMELVRDPRANGIVTAVGVGSQGGGVFARRKVFAHCKFIICGGDPYIMTKHCTADCLWNSKIMEAYWRGTQLRQGGPRKFWGKGRWERRRKWVGEEGEMTGRGKRGEGKGKDNRNRIPWNYCHHQKTIEMLLLRQWVFVWMDHELKNCAIFYAHIIWIVFDLARVKFIVFG